MAIELSKEDRAQAIASIERYFREHMDERIGNIAAGALLGFGQAGQSLMSQVAKVTFELPNSREHETEADRMGVELAARAGYDPRVAQRILKGATMKAWEYLDLVRARAAWIERMTSALAPYDAVLSPTRTAP